MSVAAALAAAARALAPVSDTARLDAELLLAHALGVERDALLLDPAGFAVPDAFASLIMRRLAHEPVAYITGVQYFWSLPFAVGPGVLIPRSDSETLIDAALTARAGAAPARILDLGCGPGTLLLAALSEWRDARGVGVERSATARRFAVENAQALGLADRTQVVAGDWTQPGWADALGQFDLILANPPYVEVDADIAAQVRGFEPAEALFAGVDGLDDYRRILPVLPRLLAPGGCAMVEIGAGQAPATSAIALQSGLAVRLAEDLAARARCLILRTTPADPQHGAA